jgi:tripartite-type tricarboxylate transporter receptor subunit TctC
MFVYRILLGAIISACALVQTVRAADDWPARPIRLIIPFPPGGSNDIIGRLMGLHLSERLGKGVVVDTAPAQEAYGDQRAAKSTRTATMVMSRWRTRPSCIKICRTIIKSFVPVTKIGNGPNVVAVFPGLPARTARS